MSIVPPTMKRTNSRELAEKAKPIFGSDDDVKSTKVEILFRCGKSRLKHVFEKSDTADYVTQFVAKTIQPSGAQFTLQARKGRNKATFNSSGNGGIGNKTLEDFGLDPRAMIKVISSTPGAVLEGARVPPAKSTHSATKSTISTGKVHHVNVKELNEILRKANSTPVVIDFFATWCGPCRAIAPHFESMAKEFKDVIFAKIDADKNRAGLASFDVKAFPTFQFFRNGAKVDGFAGGNINRLRATVQQLSSGVSSLSSSQGQQGSPNPPRSVIPPPPRSAMPRRGFGGGHRGGLSRGGHSRGGHSRGGFRPRGFGGRGGMTPTPQVQPTRKAGYDPYGGRFSTLKSISGGGGGSNAARNAPLDKKIFSATDLGFGGRGG